MPSVQIIFFCPYPLGVAPSQRFRFEQYFEILRASGFQVTVAPFLSFSGWQVLYQPGNYFKKLLALSRGFCLRWWQLFTLSGYHYVFIHREAAPVGPPVFEWIISKLFRKKIIYDFDDAIWLPNTSHVNQAAAFLKGHGKVKHICRWSYKVSVGNEYLATLQRSGTSRWCTTLPPSILKHFTILLYIRKKRKPAFALAGPDRTLHLNTLMN